MNMIKKDRFNEIKNEVEASIDVLFDLAKKNETNINDFYLFLANAKYEKTYENTIVNPYVFSNQDYILDSDRLKFLVDFLKINYNFQNDTSNDNLYNLNIELMLYSHIWESKNLIKKLKHLSNLINGITYDWNLEIPRANKGEYLRETIRSYYEKCNEFCNIIKKGYHSQIRNAFAHSDFVFELNDLEIILCNYSKKDKEIEKISYNDFTVRFCYSFLLNLYLLEKINQEKSNMKGEYEFTFPEISLTQKVGRLFYEKEFNQFKGFFIPKI
jgi:hypothetical protein